MPRSLHSEDSNCSSARASSGACCWVHLRIVAVVAVLLTDAAPLGNAVASASSHLPKVVKKSEKVAVAASMPTVKYAEAAVAQASRYLRTTPRYGSYRSGCDTGCGTQSLCRDTKAKTEEHAAESRRLTATTPKADSKDVGGTPVAIPEDDAPSERIRHLYKLLDGKVHTRASALPATRVSVGSTQPFVHRPARKDEIATTEFAVPSFIFGTGKAASVQEEWNNSAENLHDAKASTEAATTVREADGICRGEFNCFAAVSAQNPDDLQSFAVDTFAVLHSLAHGLETGKRLNSFEFPQSLTDANEELKGHSGVKPFTPSSRYSSGSRPRMELFKNYSYEVALHRSEKPDYRKQTASKETVEWNVSNVGQALEHVRAKLAYFSRRAEADDHSWDSPVETFEKQVQNLYKVINIVTLVCETERVSNVIQMQHHNTTYSDFELSAPTQEPASPFTLQVEESGTVALVHAKKRSRDFRRLKALDPSEVDLVVSNTTISMRDALHDASALVEKMYEPPLTSSRWEAVRTLQARIRNLHLAVERFKDVLRATRAAVRLLPAECPRLAGKAGKKGSVVALLMKVTARLHSTIKHIYIACERLSSTTVFFLPLLLQHAGLSPEDDLRATDCFASVTEAFHTALQRAASARVYNKKLMTALTRVAATAPQNLSIPTTFTNFMNASMWSHWKTSPVV